MNYYCFMLVVMLFKYNYSNNKSINASEFPKIFSPKKNFPPTVKSLYLWNHATNNESDHISIESNEYGV